MAAKFRKAHKRCVLLFDVCHPLMKEPIRFFLMNKIICIRFVSNIFLPQSQTMYETFMTVLNHSYLWIKALHIIAVICWMAGLFYLPRLLVYHVETANSDTQETFKIMEYKLYKIIMQPAMHLTLLSGILLAMILDTWMSPWFHLKLTAIIFLVFFHFSLNKYRKELADRRCKHTGRFFRMINEIPTVLLIIIVIAVVVKPF